MFVYVFACERVVCIQTKHVIELDTTQIVTLYSHYFLPKDPVRVYVLWLLSYKEKVYKTRFHSNLVLLLTKCVKLQFETTKCLTRILKKYSFTLPIVGNYYYVISTEAAAFISQFKISAKDETFHFLTSHVFRTQTIVYVSSLAIINIRLLLHTLCIHVSIVLHEINL